MHALRRARVLLPLLLTAPLVRRRLGVDRSGRTTYSAPFQTALNGLTVHTENRFGHTRDQFKLWVDGDGCDTRKEVLIAEADDPVTVGSGCALSGGRWYAYYDRVSWTDSGRIDIDHVVPLAEAGDSGASAWTAAQRQGYANDLGDSRTLVGVTDSVNQSKGDQDPSTWRRTYDRCRYLREWVAVTIRWRLAVDSSEKSAMVSLSSGCTNTTITVTRAI